MGETSAKDLIMFRGRMEWGNPPPHHSSGLGKFSLGSGPWHGLFVGQDLSEGLEGDQGTGMMSVWGACFWKDQAALSMPFPSVSASPTPSLPRTVGLDTGGHAGEARVHVRGEGPLAADLLLGFWKEGETEGRGYQGRVGRRGKKEEKKREREGDRDRERYLWAWWDGVAWAPAFFGGLGWNLSPWWILSLLDRTVWRAGSPRGVLPSELSSDRGVRLVCPCLLMKSGDSKWTDWGSEGPF